MHAIGCTVNPFQKRRAPWHWAAATPFQYATSINIISTPLSYLRRPDFRSSYRIGRYVYFSGGLVTCQPECYTTVPRAGADQAGSGDGERRRDGPCRPRPVALGPLCGEVRRHEGQRERRAHVARGRAALQSVEPPVAPRPAAGRVEAHRRRSEGGEGGAEADSWHF